MTKKNPSKTGVKRTHQDRSARTLAALLASARETLASDGWEGATIAAIAKRAGVAVGSVYRRFADKESLFGAVYEEFYAAAYARRAQRLESASRLRSFRAAARFVLADLVTRTRENTPVLRPYWIAALPANPKLRRRIDAANSAGFEQIADFLTARSGSRNRAAVRFALQCAAHAIRGRFLYAAAQPLDVPFSDDEFTEQITDLVVAFVGSSARRSST
jgi:AcrR family transcriptional regulator